MFVDIRYSSIGQHTGDGNGRCFVLGHLVQEVKEEMSRFLHFQPSHKKREGNAVAHKVDRMSKEFNGLNI